LASNAQKRSRLQARTSLIARREVGWSLGERLAGKHGVRAIGSGADVTIDADLDRVMAAVTAAIGESISW